MTLSDQFWSIATQYYGVDWAISLLVFIGLFWIGEHRRAGFLIGAASAALGVLFSLQIGSLANGITSLVLCVLYLRGYARWKAVHTAKA